MIILISIPYEDGSDISKMMVVASELMQISMGYGIFKIYLYSPACSMELDGL